MTEYVIQCLMIFLLFYGASELLNYIKDKKKDIPIFRLKVKKRLQIDIIQDTSFPILTEEQQVELVGKILDKLDYYFSQDNCNEQECFLYSDNYRQKKK